MSENNSRVKEVEVWVYEYHMPWILQGVSMPVHPTNKPNGGPSIKCKLLIPQEERKVEISESRLENLFSGYENGQFSMTFKDYLKQKLFSEAK